jgi:hypothetical protein
LSVVRARTVALALAGLLVAAGCGYTAGGLGASAAPLAVHLEALDEPGQDVDAAALVAQAIRRALARRPGLLLTSAGEAEVALSVRLLGVTSGLAPFSDPGLRAPQYVVTLALGAEARRGSGAPRGLPPVQGEAVYFSTPGRVEALDGARRLALARAAEDAADRLATALLLDASPR